MQTCSISGLWGVFVGLLGNIAIVYIIAFAGKYVVRSSKYLLQPHAPSEWNGHWGSEAGLEGYAKKEQRGSGMYVYNKRLMCHRQCYLSLSHCFFQRLNEKKI